MDNNTPNPMNNMMPETSIPPVRKQGIGSAIATMLVIIIIVLGGLYFWGKRIETQQANQAAYDNANAQNTTSATDTASAIEAAQIENVSTDNSINTLQNEAQSTKTSNLNGELNGL